MLVAKRDPFELGAHDRPVPHAGAAPTVSRFTRTLNVLQLLGALIAVPVGIGSAYSMYQANFSAEATCKSLRVNIVRMLDKNADAGTRHMLVRRDVETFENTCGTVDPDATKAFKALLTANRPATPAVTATARRAEPHHRHEIAGRHHDGARSRDGTGHTRCRLGCGLAGSGPQRLGQS